MGSDVDLEESKDFLRGLLIGLHIANRELHDCPESLQIASAYLSCELEYYAAKVSDKLERMKDDECIRLTELFE